MARTAVSSNVKRKSFKINLTPELAELINRMSIVFSAGLRTSLLTRMFIYGAREVGAFDGLLDAAGMVWHPMPTAEMLSRSEADRKQAVKTLLFHWSRLDSAVSTLSKHTPFHISPSTNNSIYQLRVMIHRGVCFPRIENEINESEITMRDEAFVATSVDVMLYKMTDIRIRELDWRNLSDWFRKDAIPKFADHTGLVKGTKPSFKYYFPLQTLKSDRRYEYEFLVLLQASDVFFGSNMITEEEKEELMATIDSILLHLSRGTRRWLNWNEDEMSKASVVRG